MFIAHAPAAWLLARAVVREPLVVAAAVVGGIVPDVDMLYWLLDGGRVHHHAYPTHWPITWIVVTVAGLLPAVMLSSRRRHALLTSSLVVAALGAGGLVHMVLDTIAGDVRWLAPLDQRAFSLVTVPATQSHWILSFLLHWTFALELSICGVALAVSAASRSRDRTTKSTARGC